MQDLSVHGYSYSCMHVHSCISQHYGHPRLLGTFIISSSYHNECDCNYFTWCVCVHIIIIINAWHLLVTTMPSFSMQVHLFIIVSGWRYGSWREGSWYSLAEDLLRILCNWFQLCSAVNFCHHIRPWRGTYVHTYKVKNKDGSECACIF